MPKSIKNDGKRKRKTKKKEKNAPGTEQKTENVKGKGGNTYRFLPKSGSIFKNAVTRKVMRQHAMTMMKNMR